MATEVARASTVRGELVLLIRELGDTTAFELRANGVFVMDTVETGTERALARASLALAETPGRVLVGGLGLGFTLAEVLADPRVQHCTVVEIEPALVGWMRDGAVPGAELLADPRVEVVVADVREAIQQAPSAAYDLVLLDVDNGPGHLVHDANAGLYRAPALHAVRRLLRPGGAVALWSAAAAPDLRQALLEVYDDADALELPVRLQQRDESYWIYSARTGSVAEPPDRRDPEGPNLEV